MRTIFYSDDVSILEHAQMIVYLADGVKNAIFIERDDDSEQYFVYGVELFTRPSDSWIKESDLKAINTSCDAKYIFDQELSEHDQYLFTSDLCWYYGAVNFDSDPIHFISFGSFKKWLKEMELID